MAYELEPVGVTLAILITILIIGIVYLIARIVKRRREEGPDHIHQYFDSNFRNIIDEWDLVSRTQMKDWKSDMNRRLSTVGKDISYIEDYRKGMDPRLDRLESEIGKLESM